MSQSQLNNAAEILKKGGVVIFPTDTVYGIGCRFDDQRAVARIHQIKGIPQNQPFPILVSTIDQVEKLAKVNHLARRLIKKYWPGSLTIILNEKIDNQKLGFRMPDSPFVLSLIDNIATPIIGTSANLHGQKTPRSFEELDPKIVNLVDFVVKGKCKLGVESTVVDTTVNPPKILRQGATRLVMLNSFQHLDPETSSG